MYYYGYQNYAAGVIGILVLAGIVTGFFTGQCTQAVLNHLDKLKHTAESSTSPKD